MDSARIPGVDAPGEHDSASLRDRIRPALSRFLTWLDRYWDDPELRSGFWRSGW